MLCLSHVLLYYSLFWFVPFICARIIQFLTLFGAHAIPIDNGLVGSSISEGSFSQSTFNLKSKLRTGLGLETWGPTLKLQVLRFRSLCQVNMASISECSNTSAVDLVFVLDGSGSIGDNSFDAQKQFASLLLDQLDVGADAARVGVVQYSDNAVLEMALGDQSDLTSVKWALNRIRYLSGTTLTGAAMQFTLQTAFKQARRGGVAQVAVVLTDGQSQDSVVEAATALREADVLVYAIGVTNLVNLNQLYQIAGTPTRVFTVESFERLDQRLAKLITREMCKFDFQPGFPDIVCEADRIGVRATTKKPFEGYVFVKNHFHNPDCRRSAESFGNPTKIGLDIAFTSCDVRRWRSLSPRGVYVQTTIVFMQHQLFMTKVDQAIKVECFYMEADKTVDTPLEVSMITTEFRERTYPMPTCVYSVRVGSPEGPIIRYASIGQKVFHRWECIENDVRFDTFGMLVHSCFVDDGSGDAADLIDPQGCGRDIHLVQTPSYDPSLRLAIAETHIFKYADRPVLEFQCQITVCIKYNGECDAITPPKCPLIDTRRNFNRRFGRQVTDKSTQEHNIEHTMDVLTAPITVLELMTPEQTPHAPYAFESAGGVVQWSNEGDASPSASALPITQSDPAAEHCHTFSSVVWPLIASIAGNVVLAFVLVVTCSRQLN